MRRENKMREGDNKTKFLSILFLSMFCFSCVFKNVPTISFEPAIDLSRIYEITSFKNKEKQPYNVALIIPQAILGRNSIEAECSSPSSIFLYSKRVSKNQEFPVEVGNSTKKIFKRGLEKFFKKVELIYEEELRINELDHYSLVIKIESADFTTKDKSVYDAYANYVVSIHTVRDTFNKRILVNGRGEYHLSFGRDLSTCVFSFPVYLVSLGLASFIYNPDSYSDGGTLGYSYAFESAQERAFGSFIAELFEDPRFVEFSKAEPLRLAAKCNLTTSPLFTDQHAIIPNSLLDAVEAGEIVVSVSNNGEGSGFGVQLKITSNNSHTSIVEQYDVGEISPGKTKKVTIPISADLELEDGWEELYIETKEKRGYDAPPVKLKIQTARLEKPELAISSVEINDGNRGSAKGNGNGIPENEETVELVAFIKNSGEGPGRKVKLELEEINSGVEIIRKSQEIGTVNVGEIVKGKVVIRIPRTFDEKKLEYRLRVADARKGAAEDEKEFVLNLGILRPVLAYGHKVKDSGFSGASGNGNGQMENGEKIALIITPRNNGTTGAQNVSLTINPPYGVSADRQRVSIGSLAQGKDGQLVEFILFIPRTYDSTSLSIPIKISQSDFPGVEDQISIPVRLVKPRLELAVFSLNGVQGNTLIGKNQEAELEVIIKNSGELAAEGLTVTLHHSAKGVILKEENRTIGYGTLQPGMETDRLRFPLFIQQSAETGSFPIRITISQNIFPKTSEPIQLAIQEGAVHEFVAKGEKLKSSRSYISLNVNFPPKIMIDSPFPGDRLTEPEVTLRFRVSDDEEIRKVDILVNGINLTRGPGGLKSQLKGERRHFRNRKNIALVEGANTIQIIAYDNRNERAEEKVTVHYSKELGLGRIFAIIIGIADYKYSGVRDLQYTENDARALKDFLMSNEGGRVPEERIKFLVGPEATTANIRSAVGDWLITAANRRNDRVILFFAGHGVKKMDEGYFIAYNTDPDRIVGTAVEMQDITKYLYKVEANTVIFLSDACHSGAAFEQKLTRRGDNMDGGFLINQISGVGRITMVAAKSGQESIELPAPYEHGLFTYFLLKGLKGEADRGENGGNGDKKVDIHELYRYVYDQVTEEAKKQNFSQSPKMDSQVEGDIIMAIVP